MRTVRFLSAIVGCALPLAAPAQDAAGWIEELRELRKTVEVQSRQIEVLTAQVARLAALVEGKALPDVPAAPAASAEEFSPAAPAPKAEPEPPRHVVMKGETLTSIARHYNVALPELMKANKGLDERKLQIGQTINLPTPPNLPEPKANP